MDYAHPKVAGRIQMKIILNINYSKVRLDKKSRTDTSKRELLEGVWLWRLNQSIDALQEKILRTLSWLMPGKENSKHTISFVLWTFFLGIVLTQPLKSFSQNT